MLCPPQPHKLSLLIAHHVIHFPLLHENNPSEKETLHCPSPSEILSSIWNLAWVLPPRIHWVRPRGGTPRANSLFHLGDDGVHFCLGPCTIRVSIGQWCSMVEAFSVRLLGSYSSSHSPLLFFIFGSPTLWILQTSHDVTHWGKVGSSSGDYTLLAGAGFGLAMAWFSFLIYSPLAGSCL